MRRRPRALPGSRRCRQAPAVRLPAAAPVSAPRRRRSGPGGPRWRARGPAAQLARIAQRMSASPHRCPPRRVRGARRLSPVLSIPPGSTTRPTSRRLRAVRRWLDALPAAPACSTRAVAKASSSTSTPDDSTSKVSTRTTPRIAFAQGSVTALPLRRRRVRSRAVSRRAGASHRSRSSRARSPNCTASLQPGGELFVSVPNLAHLQSRVQFLLRGRLIRTASEFKHPGDRPAAEYRRLWRGAPVSGWWAGREFFQRPGLTRTSSGAHPRSARAAASAR